jgi:hypothetical protein
VKWKDLDQSFEKNMLFRYIRAGKGEIEEVHSLSKSSYQNKLEVNKSSWLEFMVLQLQSVDFGHRRLSNVDLNGFGSDLKLRRFLVSVL